MPTAMYADWLLQTDMSSAYAYERTVLQMLQSRAPGTWSLPSHAVHIEALLATYPDGSCGHIAIPSSRPRLSFGSTISPAPCWAPTSTST